MTTQLPLEVKIAKNLFHGKKSYTPLVKRGEMIIQKWGHSFATVKKARAVGDWMKERLEKQNGTA